MDLTRKSIYVAVGHLTDPHSYMNYSSVVRRDSVRMAFLISALNDLDILAGDVQNEYLNAPTKEKLFFYAGDECKSYPGKFVIVFIALYGLNPSVFAWRNHLFDILGNHIGFQSSLADPDVWFKAATDKTGNEYYNSILVYVDDFLFVEKYLKSTWPSWIVSTRHNPLVFGILRSTLELMLENYCMVMVPVLGT